MENNSFKRMQEDNLRKNPEAPERVRTDFEGNVGFISMVSKVLEVYLPRVFDIFVMWGGGKREEEDGLDDKGGKPPSNGGFNEKGPNIGPSAPDKI